MFADCEGCHNLTLDENGNYICERYCGAEINRIHHCEEWTATDEPLEEI